MLKIEEISLASCSYHFIPVSSEEQEADVSISFFTKRDPIKCKDIFCMTVLVGFCVISENTKTECNYLVNYTADTEEQFSVLQDKVIVSHIIPYLRELIAGLTMRSNSKVINIPPTNTNLLLKAYNEKQGDQQAQE